MYRLSLSLLFCFLLIPTGSAFSLTPHLLRGVGGGKLDSPSPRIEATLNSNDIRSIAQAITVKILVGNTAATGFIIAKDGNAYTVVTNAHVVSRSRAYQIKTLDGAIYPAILTYQDNSNTGNDLALIKFSSTQSYAVAELGNSANLSENEEIYSAGYPYDSNELVFNRGTISLITDKPIKGGYQIGFTSETQQGMSGSPLLNSEGFVIGVLGLGSYAILEEAYTFSDGTRPDREILERMKKASFAVPVAQLNTLIASNKETSPPPASNYTGFIADIDKIAEEITVRIDGSNNENGSGVIVARNGQTYYVLTASHVVKNQDTYQVVTPDGEQYPVNYKTVTIFEGLDIAVLEFTSTKTYTVARLGKYNLGLENFGVLEPIGKGWMFVSGFPGFTATHTTKPKRYLSSGRIWSRDTASFTAKDQYSLYEGNDLVYTAISYGGMSGGAVLDSQGRVIGINTGAENEYTGSQEINIGQSLGIPITTFIGVASKAQIQPNWLTVETDKPSDLTKNEVEQIRNQLFTLQVPNDKANALDWLNYCNGLWRSFQYNEAIKACDRAISQQPKGANAYYLKGLSYVHQLKYQEALLAFEEATKIDPKFHSSWRWQGFSLYQLQHYTEALAAYQQAIEIAPGEFAYYVEQGAVLYQLKNYSQAIESSNKALTIKQHSWAYTGRGLLYYELKEYDKALSDFGKTIDISPLYEEAYNNRGLLYYELKEYEKALSDLDKAIEINPQLVQAYNNRGNVYSELKENENALSDYGKAIEINPQLALAYYNRGNLYYKELKENEKALTDYSKAIEINPQYAQAYIGRGLVYYETGNKQQTTQDFQTAAELFRQQGNMEAYKVVMELLQQL